jgi:ankyrin repeat protein
MLNNMSVCSLADFLEDCIDDMYQGCLRSIVTAVKDITIERQVATPLHVACAKGHLEVVKYLMQNGIANVEAPTNDGCTALHIASVGPHLDTMSK